MFAECNRESFGFHPIGRRDVVARFDGGRISSNAGGLLLRETERVTGIIDQFAACFTDHRDPERIEHTVGALVAQRVHALALGYEDLNDHDDLRFDPLLATVVGKADPKGQDRARLRDRGAGLAGKNTLNRIELARSESAATHRYNRIVLHEESIDQVFLDVFLQSFDEPPSEIILDFDATDDPLHGQQEGRFFHAYYGHYCYLPLYVFCGDHLLCARLRPSNIDGAAGSVDELARIVPWIRQQWPEVKIIVRGDSGFCREEIMVWCEENAVDFVLGFARNSRLERRLSKLMTKAKRKQKKTGRAARYFGDFQYRTRSSWCRSRRVIGKAEYLSKGPNPRFIVTSLTRGQVGPKQLYEKTYCARGDMENRIKEQQLFLFADRTSSSSFRANQTRLYFSSMAYLLIDSLRRVGLRGTDMARAQCNTIRTKLLKIGAKIRVTVRRVWVSMTQACPYASIFRAAVANLRASPT